MITDFDKARPGEEAFVYVCPPGDEYGWVTGPEWFEDQDEPITVKRQQWQLICEDTVVFHPTTELCSECHGEGEHPESVTCPTCNGDGRHPKAGQMEVK